ncbi:uncharacterized protein EAE97_004038 [Botrytis byssoidea]|uniref:Uncharacterized protein n=1 Tax=Botrytis byssoidea TaxID=139641 RepID=A0A9P5ISR0_9HELO|nr:uncharacterized protein EAE97_004038 [Botrytis byssoidea]KAF7948627.1 hypothetical protein EAE97_004038 [Botrytis byssoidea]
MSEIYYNDYFLDDQYQFLDGVDLHSPIYPVEDDQAVQAPPQAFQFEDYLDLPDEEMQGNPTQVELPLPHITDNAAVNPQFFNQGFTGTMQPVQHVPAPFEFPPHYQNSILNDFPDAAYPLHIIDQAGRLPRHVTAALLQGVKRRREFDDEILQVMASGIDISEPFGLEQQPNKKRETSKGKGKALAISIEQDPEDLALSDYEYDAENFALSDNEDEPESTQAAGPAPKERETPVRPIKVPGKKWIKPNATTQGKNKRSRNIQSMNPSRFYTPLAQPPRSWGTPNRAGVHPFQYTKDGELKPHVRYTVNQIQEFIFNHPGHTGQGQRHTKNSGLTLWVQSVPSDSAARYSHQNSDKCRFEDCPVRNGTIHKGHYRVAFDEQSSDPVVTDPFHNAGHVHLYCLEKFLDFPFICANFNVRPDYRIFPEGRNKMAITRDHLEMKKVVGKFIRHAERNFASQGTTAPRHRYSYENTLSYALTAKALELEPRNRQKFRDSRPNANSIDKHMNNLDLFVAGLTTRKDKQVGENASGSEAPLVRQPRMKNNKRKAAEVDEDDDAEFEVDETVLDADDDTVLVDTAGRAPQFKPSPRPVKKPRVEIKRNARKAIAISSDSSGDNDSGDDSDISEWAPAVKRSRSR